MEKKKRTKELRMREWQYFGLNLVVYICIATGFLLVLDFLLQLFPINLYIKLILGLVTMGLAAVVTKYIASHNLVRVFLNQFRVEK